MVGLYFKRDIVKSEGTFKHFSWKKTDIIIHSKRFFFHLQLHATQYPKNSKNSRCDMSK